LQGANSIDEAVSQFFENPDKYSQASVSTSHPPHHDKNMSQAFSSNLEKNHDYESKMLGNPENAGVMPVTPEKSGLIPVAPANGGMIPVNPEHAGLIPADSHRGDEAKILADHTPKYAPPSYAPPTHARPAQSANGAPRRAHTNAVIQAGHVRARDEVRLLLRSSIRVR
jgi:hypothetical protein